MKLRIAKKIARKIRWPYWEKKPVRWQTYARVATVDTKP